MVTLPVKNVVAIYDLLLKPLLLTTGLWELVRVDHGREFALVTSVQQSLAPLRGTHTLVPVLQSTSRQNHRVERLWPEGNQRINDPVKQVLVEMENNGEIDMNCEVTKFCVSFVSIMVVSEPTSQFISAWNMHRVPRRNGGIPNVLAIAFHEQQTGNRLTRVSRFGTDHLYENESLQRLRDQDFTNQYPNMQLIFTELLHRSPQLFKSAIAHHIQLTFSFSSLL